MSDDGSIQGIKVNAWFIIINITCIKTNNHEWYSIYFSEIMFEPFSLTENKCEG